MWSLGWKAFLPCDDCKFYLVAPAQVLSGIVAHMNLYMKY